MAYETGGRADKFGNRFEYNWTIYQLLNVVSEKIRFVVVEAIGEDEKGIDLWIGNLDGSKEAQQCKARRGSFENWTVSRIIENGIISNWKHQLSRADNINVSLVSPLTFTIFEDIILRAKNSDGNPKQFYEYQIEKSGAKTKSEYKNYCKGMDIDVSNLDEIANSINYLSRTFYRNMPDSELKELLYDRIRYHFHGNDKDIYDSFLSLIISGDILGNKIDINYINKYLDDKNIKYKNLVMDTRIKPRIIELNEEYKESFIPLKKGLFKRENLHKSINIINAEGSLMIHGKAGIGKSGYLENIIEYCETENIPYLAIKLDKRIPSYTSDKYGESMGLRCSPVHCLDSISSERNAVLILDQLDALRWTQAHSGLALDVCTQMIREVVNINKGRKRKISVIMASRTYDFRNDGGIKKFFERTGEKHIKWHEIQIIPLTKDEIEFEIGDVYNKLTNKTKNLLSIPNNLYIWQHLDDTNSKHYINSTRELVNKWWVELERRASLDSLIPSDLVDIKNKMVKFCDRNGRVNIPSQILEIPKNYLEFLQSNGFILVTKNLISFAHQSILDTFLSELMIQQFYDNNEIENIIGEKRKQTPGRRYQVQLFMEQLLVISDEDFIQVGNLLLESNNIRWSFKFVFIELLNTIDRPTQFILNSVINYIKDNNLSKYFTDNVIGGKKCYIDKLQENGIFEEWYINNQIDKVITLYSTISSEIDEYNVEFIEKFSFINKDNDKKWFNGFGRRISEETDSLFELRVKFYEKYPEFIREYIDFNELIKVSRIRGIKILGLMLEYSIKENIDSFSDYNEKYIFEDSNLFSDNYEIIIDSFFKLLPSQKEDFYFSKWSSENIYRKRIERVCIEMIKKANSFFARNKSEAFLKKYSHFQCTGNDLYNEIYLDALYYLPDNYADDIVYYLCDDFNKTMFESSSGNGNKLTTALRLLSKISIVCSDDAFAVLESKIIHFISDNSLNLLKLRNEYGYIKTGMHISWRFWGDFQYECLLSLDNKRLSRESKNLIQVLSNKIGKNISQYAYDKMSRAKAVNSPVSNKELSPVEWRKIITNKKIKIERNRFRETKNGYIDYSKEEFARSFEAAVSKDPNKFLTYFINVNEEMHELYVDSLYSGISYSDFLNDIDNQVIEELFSKFPYNYTNSRALNICRIIENKNCKIWSEDTMYMLADIAIYHENPLFDKFNVIPSDDKEIKLVTSIETNAINCVRGVSLRAIGSLLWDNEELYPLFKDTIKRKIDDPNIEVQYACLYSLWPIYNIDREWAIEHILVLYNKDIRMCGFQDSKNMLLILYKEYKEVILNLVLKCFEQTLDERLITVGAYSIVELYMMHNEFEGIILECYKFSNSQKEKIMQMLVTYFNIPEYYEKAKKVLMLHINDEFELYYPCARLFYDKFIDVDRDKDLIEKLLSLTNQKSFLRTFVDFLGDSNISLLKVSDLVLNMSRELIQNYKSNKRSNWEIEDEISKIIIALYDDSSDKNIQGGESIAQNCLDIWDYMYENNIGVARKIANQLMEI